MKVTHIFVTLTLTKENKKKKHYKYKIHFEKNVPSWYFQDTFLFFMFSFTANIENPEDTIVKVGDSLDNMTSVESSDMRYDRDKCERRTYSSSGLYGRYVMLVNQRQYTLHICEVQVIVAASNVSA